jgi:hypothetical protein
MGTERLSSIAILAVKSVITKNEDNDIITNKIAAAKFKKKNHYLILLHNVSWNNQ